MRFNAFVFVTCVLYVDECLVIYAVVNVVVKVYFPVCDYVFSIFKNATSRKPKTVILAKGPLL